MSAHGEIKVNGEIVAAWSALRIRNGEPHLYRAVLMEGDMRHETEVEHSYSDGLSILASKVLATRPNHWPVPIPKTRESVTT